MLATVYRCNNLLYLAQFGSKPGSGDFFSVIEGVYACDNHS